MQNLQYSFLTSEEQQQQQQQQGGSQADIDQQQRWPWQPLQRHPSQPSSEAAQQPGPVSDAVMVLGSPRHPGLGEIDVKEPLLLPSSPVKPAAVAAPTTKRRCPALQELKTLLVLALPTIVTTAAQQIIIVTSQMFSGHIGTDEMAAAALSNTWWNLMWYVLLGVSTALDTLGSQAVGAGDKTGLVVWTFAAAIILTVINIPMAVGLWYGGGVAQHLFGQGPEVSQLVQHFCRYLLPGLWPMSMAQLLQKHLQTQGLVGAPAVTSGLSIIINIAATWLGTDMLGLRGVSMAATATRVLLLVSMVAAVYLCESRAGRVCCTWCWRDTWTVAGERVRAALRSDVLCTYLSLGIPGGLMLGLECASFEVTTALAGYLGPAEVAAHAGVFAITSLCYIALPFALATAATIRVGNLLGAGHAERAATTSRVVVGLGSGFMALCGVGIYLGRFQLGEMFTAGDAEVMRAIAMIAPLGAAYQVFDGVLGTTQGVLRGLGRQAQLMCLNMVAFWLIGVPTGYHLTFGLGWGLRGLWVGMSLGGFLAASISLGIMLCVKWNKEVEGARECLSVQNDNSGSNSDGEDNCPEELLLQDELQPDLIVADTV